MTPPGPTIKTFQKRLYTVLPRGVAVTRVRSNSASASSRALHNYSPAQPYFDPSAPTPSSRPGNPHLLSTTRLPIEARTEPEAPNSGHSQHTHTGHAPPSSLALTSPHSSNTVSSSQNGIPLANFHAPPFFYINRSHHRAYGIPKFRPSNVISGRDGVGGADLWSHNSKLTEGLDLAVQVGEDAYFIRDNAMGVADGVGGWSRTHSPKGAPSPSALFARRLMHFCSTEVVAQASTPAVSFHDVPPSSKTTFFPYPAPASPTHSKIQEDPNDDTMEDLVDGLDVLLILERAYERALKAHVVAPCPLASTPSLPAPSEPEPLLTGSSTALLAVLDSAGSHVPTPEVSVVPEARAHDAVIRIAHLGDCMGMLVRGDGIVWRSEEMWWRFNTPLQLGPRSSTLPSAAQVFTIPVHADDILILASDGLSDNLWDEDVLDEVVRFRQTFLASTSTTTGSQLPRRTLAGMLSEALCSRARTVSQRRSKVPLADELATSPLDPDEEIPFARRAHEAGRTFSGGKSDDISVLVAVISPAGDIAETQ
ncbi:phosphatase 2C-like domain-containing protein [Lactarius quietus]|nr:phosphatase 2C-like domain-containing protein [Lactarius quietus]